MVYQMLPDFFGDSSAGCQKACWDDHCRFSMLFHRVNDVLQEHQVDGHAAFILVWHIGHTGKEPFLICLSRQGVPVIAEIHIKGRIADDIIKFSKAVPLGVQMPGRNQRIVVNHIPQRVNQIIQDQVQP